jgi:hypothetical protein
LALRLTAVFATLREMPPYVATKCFTQSRKESS